MSRSAAGIIGHVGKLVPAFEFRPELALHFVFEERLQIGQSLPAVIVPRLRVGDHDLE